MMNGKGASSPIDKAVASAEAPVPTAGVQVRVSSGRTLVLSVPIDLNGQEAMDLIGYIATQLPLELAKVQKPRSPLVIATGPLPT